MLPAGMFLVVCFVLGVTHAQESRPPPPPRIQVAVNSEHTYLDDQFRLHTVGRDICYDLIQPVDFLLLQCPLVGVRPDTSNNVTRTWSKITDNGENVVLFSLVDSVQPLLSDGQEFYDRFPGASQFVTYGFSILFPDIFPHDLLFYAKPETQSQIDGLAEVFGTWNCTVYNSSGSDSVLTTIVLSDNCTSSSTVLPTESPACEGDQFQCPGGSYSFCIPSDFLCDTYPDCNDGYDELNCSYVCSFNNETYANGETFPAGDDCNYCTCIDTIVSCSAMYCPEPCGKYEFRCPDEEFSLCYPLEYICDSVRDCYSGYDEQNCSIIELSTPFELSVREGATTKAFEFCLTLSTVSQDFVIRQFPIVSTPRSARANLDYVFGNNTVTFNGSYSVGDSECVVVTVSAPSDNLVEGTEYFIANIYTLDIQVFIFIVDRDYLKIGFLEEVYYVSESAGVLEIAVGVVNGNTTDVGIPLGVRIMSIDISAIDGIDYEGILTTLYILPGEPPHEVIEIPIFDDSLPEGDKQFTVELKAYDVSIILVNAVTKVVITDDEESVECTVVLDAPIQVNGNSASYSFTGVGSDIERFICKLNGAVLDDCSSPLTDLTPGLHRLRVVPVGCAKNKGQTFRFEV